MRICQTRVWQKISKKSVLFSEAKMAQRSLSAVGGKRFFKGYELAPELVSLQHSVACRPSVGVCFPSDGPILSCVSIMEGGSESGADPESGFSLR